MSSLKEIVLELQEQNRSLDDVKSDIRELVRQREEQKKAEENAAGDREEQRREEARNKQKLQRTGSGPAKSFSQGVAQSFGLDGILGKMGGPFAGILGGATLGGLLGAATGKLFLGAAGAFLGGEYLDRWLSPIIDKITGEDASITMLGQQIDVSKLVSSIAAGIGLIFAPKVLGAAVKSWFEKDATDKGPSYRQKFLRRLGLSAVILTAAGFAGDWLKEQGVAPGFADAVGSGLTAAGIGLQLFGVKGMIIGALAGLAYSGLKALTDYLNNRRSELVAEQLEKARAEIEIFDDPNSTANQQVQSMLDAKTAISKAEAAAKRITDEEQRQAALEAARFARAQRFVRLSEAARIEQQSMPEGQLLLTPELAAERLANTANGGGKVDTASLAKYLRERVKSDLDADALAMMSEDKDNLRAYLEGVVGEVSQQHGLISTMADKDSAVASVLTELTNKVETIKASAPEVLTGKGTRAMQSPGSARIRMRDTLATAGSELNALDAIAATQPITMINNYNSTAQSAKGGDTINFGNKTPTSRNSTSYEFP